MPALFLRKELTDLYSCVKLLLKQRKKRKNREELILIAFVPLESLLCPFPYPILTMGRVISVIDGVIWISLVNLFIE